jgi:hypothetical protein
MLWLQVGQPEEQINMFRIEVFVEDKRLSAFLHAVAGLVTSMSPPAPVVNVQENGSLQAASNGSVPKIFYAELKRKKMQEFTPTEAKSMLAALGTSEKSYNYVCKILRAQKHIKLIQRGKWKVL